MRKVIYLAISLLSEPSGGEVIDIERLDFGELFEDLFTDNEFIKNVRTKINDKSWKYNKDEIIDDLQCISEDTKWDKLLGADIVPTLRKNFITIKNYRNKIMHAHNITTEDYKNIEEMYFKTNKELDCAIDDIINDKIDKLKEGNKDEMNEIIKTLAEHEKTQRHTLDIGSIAEQLKGISDMSILLNGTNLYKEQFKGISDMSNLLNGTNLYKEQFKGISDMSNLLNGTNLFKEQLNDLSKLAGTIRDIAPHTEQLKGLSDMSNIIKGMNPLTEQLKEISKLAGTIRDIAPYAEQLKGLSEISNITKENNFLGENLEKVNKTNSINLQDKKSEIEENADGNE